ncbi:MAG: type II secretion system minor pseudopilin GspH [Psychromonas sp.]
MLNRAKKYNFQGGFTLLEIMLVLMVMAMASVGVMMAMPHQINESENVDWQAQRFSVQLQFAEDQALISGKELALVFRGNSYRFTFYDFATKKWIALPSEQIGKVIEIPESLRFEYQLLGSVWDEIESQDDDSFLDQDDLIENDNSMQVESFSPQVFIMSSGEVTPFSLLFSEAETTVNQRSHLVEVNMSGSITMTKSGVQ